MKWMLPMLVAGGLGLLAWPVVNEPTEPALEFVDMSKTDWTGQRAGWTGDEARRNAILMSAVWGGNDRR